MTLQKEVEEMNGRNHLPYRPAISVGSAEYHPNTPSGSVEGLLHAADAEMYRQKKENETQKDDLMRKGKP